MAKTDDILSELNNKFFELAGQVIEQKLNDKIQNLLIGKDNLSPELKQMIMAKQTSGGGTYPSSSIPQSSSIPTSTTSEAPPLDLNDPVNKGIMADLIAGNNVYLYGKAGTGKTVKAEKIAEILGEGFGNQEGNGAGKRTINCSQWTSPTEIRGGQTITGYKQGTMIDAWRDGDILILDELPKLDPNTAGLLNDVLSKAADAPEVDDNGKVKWRKSNGAISWVYTTDGKGAKIYKGGFEPDIAIDLYNNNKEKELNEYVNSCYKKAKRFGVIGTGNTDMKTMSPNFGGNNRQDYSLVDRFSGAYYEITFEETEKFEKQRTYPIVRDFMYKLRNYLSEQNDIQEAVSARTVLNVNRIYEQQKLISLQSPFAVKGVDGKPLQMPLKTMDEGVNNFINTFPPQLAADFKNKFPNYLTELKKTGTPDDDEQFIDQFSAMYGVNVFDGSPIPENELQELRDRMF